MGSNPHIPPSRAVKFALRRDGLTRLRKRNGNPTDKQLADLIGITQSQYYRIVAEKCDPGVRFVAGLLQTYGMDQLSTLFDLIPDGSAQRSSKGAA